MLGLSKYSYSHFANNSLLGISTGYVVRLDIYFSTGEEPVGQVGVSVSDLGAEMPVGGVLDGVSVPQTIEIVISLLAFPTANTEAAKLFTLSSLGVTVMVTDFG